MVAEQPKEDVLDWALREWARAKIQKLHILNYNGANLAYRNHARMANALRLSEQQKQAVAPYPASSSQVFVMGGDEVSSAPSEPPCSDVSPPRPVSEGTATTSRWPAIIGAGLLGAGIPLAGMAGYMYGQQGNTTTPVVEQVEPAPDLGEVGYTVR